MWYAIYTKAGREDAVTALLQKAGIDVLNAKLRSRKFRHERLAEITEPLFPCYIFADFEAERFAHTITYTRGVRYIVGKHNPIACDDIVRAIKENLQPDNIVVLKTPEFRQGSRVVVKDGPFKNLVGLFQREIRGPERVMILLETLHCRLEIDGCLLAVA
ncbi:MAG TPA: transcription termination/antitermination NusG family protein [Thermodesulfovibrionales bacterium]|nr:transcription termination/antitermination NusG family protein [Thermodesulfovibrionales bacterium]